MPINVLVINTDNDTTIFIKDFELGSIIKDDVLDPTVGVTSWRINNATDKNIVCEYTNHIQCK